MTTTATTNEETTTMTIDVRSGTIDEIVQVYRDLKVLPDRNLAPDVYSAEWRRLDAERARLAKLLSSSELQEAHDRAKFAC